MADLSAYIAFSATLNKSGVSPIIKITDPGTQYPVGVALTIEGYITITQPDGITIQSGSAGSPIIFWDSGALVQPEIALRLANNGSFQNGSYRITYTLNATGYDETVLTKTFTLNYTAPTLVITSSFNVFTPNLSVSDSTSYTISGASLSGTVKSWVADIISVSGTNQQITSSGSTFDLAYLGDYYDSQYDIELTSVVTYVLSSPSNWVTLVDSLATDETLYASIPPSVDTLLDSLDELKIEMDEAQASCSSAYLDIQRNFMLASDLYYVFRKRGCEGDFTDLYTYLLQLQRLFNNNVTPSYTNTNGVIPAYDWECGGGGGSTAWVDITGKPSTVNAQWKVGAGGFPGIGATTYTTSSLTDVPASRVLMIRNGIPQLSADQGDGDTYFTKVTADNFITFPALLPDEKIQVYIFPL